jgi:starch phosphorylase
VFAYTNHTVLPEALERWPVELLQRLLPRHMQIIDEVDRRHRLEATVRTSDDGTVARTAIVDAGQIHMARLAFVGSHSVNGVAALHTRILASATFADLNRLYPGRLNNKTNGITQRRWLLLANPGLAKLVTDAIGEQWTTDPSSLEQLAPLASDASFREEWAVIKRVNKLVLADHARRSCGVDLDPEALFDCQVKRIHEYKRQLLNALHAIALCHRIREGDLTGVPRMVIFAGKAAPGYAMAKLVIKLIHAVAEMIEREPRTRGRLRVVFIPNYSVSLAEVIFPACELSEQISAAGTEASGTGNMKAALNGSLTIGTLDGANVEIREAVGAENIFIFGQTAEEAAARRQSGYAPRSWIANQPELARAVATLASGELEQRYPGLFRPIVDMLFGEDRYFHCLDFAAYAECQQRAGAAYLRPAAWTRMSILNTARMGRFSTDRTTREYAEKIWHVAPIRRP